MLAAFSMLAPSICSGSVTVARELSVSLAFARRDPPLLKLAAMWQSAVGLTPRWPTSTPFGLHQLPFGRSQLLLLAWSPN